MALFNFVSGPGWSFQIEYNESTLRADALYCENHTPHSIWGWVRLADGRTFERTFAPAGTFPDNVERVNIPNNVVRITTEVRDGETITWPSPIVEYQVTIKFSR